eukprot:CAMPEP_0196570966 /NCGR_PEP_ID=MMETSP1081-20130531/1135_1 /TAXON_ID=36882 /ORGANISM="Pyramimonas amylifera, Strain CCMP720" /LENGTH=252 /DNA_ID=CAMNT_0041887683 /DNA_START=159 /DNA_END=914 /DNA_ORIENTATION=-
MSHSIEDQHSDVGNLIHQEPDSVSSFEVLAASAFQPKVVSGAHSEGFIADFTEAPKAVAPWSLSSLLAQLHDRVKRDSFRDQLSGALDQHKENLASEALGVAGGAHGGPLCGTSEDGGWADGGLPPLSIDAEQESPELVPLLQPGFLGGSQCDPFGIEGNSLGTLDGESGDGDNDGGGEVDFEVGMVEVSHEDVLDSMADFIVQCLARSSQANTLTAEKLQAALSHTLSELRTSRLRTTWNVIKTSYRAGTW